MRRIAAVLGALVFLLSVATVSADQAATAYIGVKGPNYDSGPIVNDYPRYLIGNFGYLGGGVVCSDYGTKSWSLNWGQRSDCTSRTTNQEGTYHFYYGLSQEVCSGPQGTATIPPTAVERTGPVVDFVASSSGTTRYDDYCDKTAPTDLTVSSLPNYYYRNSVDTGVTMGYTETGGGRAYQMYWNHRPGGTGSGTGQYLNCQSVSTNAGGTLRSCSVTSNVHIGPTDWCNVEGAHACEVTYRGYNYWEERTDNTHSIVRYYNVDFTPPLSQMPATMDNPQYDAYAGQKWYADSTNVVVFSRDNVGHPDQAGLDYIRIGQVNDGTNSCPNRGSLSYTVHSASGIQDQATQTFSYTGAGTAVHACYYAEDAAKPNPGNVESVKHSSTFYIDGQAPTTTISPSPASSAPGALSDGWTQNGDFDVTLTCSDPGGSGCDTIHYTSNANSDTTSCSPGTNVNVNGNPSVNPVSYTYTGQLCASGNDCVFTFCASSTDNVGHDSTVPSVTYKIDRRSPQIQSVADSPTNTRRNLWHKQDFQLTVTANDNFDGPGGPGGSGLGTCTVTNTANGRSTSAACSGQTDTFTFTITVGSGGICNTQGACPLRITVADRVGNSVSQDETYYADFSNAGNPTCTADSLTSTNDCTYFYNGVMYYGTCSGTFDVTATGTDPGATSAGSGIYSLEWGSVTGATPSPAVSTTASVLASFSPSATYTTSNAGSTSNTSVPLAVDDRAEGAQGNYQANACRFTVNHDNVPPTSTVSTSTGATTGIWTSGPFSFNVIATDDKIPVRTINYDYFSQQNTPPPVCPNSASGLSQSGNPVSGNLACSAGQVCYGRVCYSAEDQVSNNESVKEAYYGVDMTDPSLAYSFDAPVIESAGQTYTTLRNWTRTDFTITFTATDTGSGVADCTIKYRAKGSASWTTLNNQCPGATSDGTLGGEVLSTTATSSPIRVGPSSVCNIEGADACEIEISVTDAVGNTKTWTDAVSVDYTAPTCYVSNAYDVPTGAISYAEYNSSTNEWRYGNPPSTQPYYIEITANDTNAGHNTSEVWTIQQPDLTSAGGTNTSTPPSLTYTAKRGYTFDSSSSQTGTRTFTVTDRAGNVGTCTMDLVRDVTGPTVTGGSVRYDHIVAEDIGRVEPDLNLSLDVAASDPSGIQAIQINMIRTPGSGATGVNGTPTCRAFPVENPSGDSIAAFMPNDWTGPINSTTYSEWSGPSGLWANVTNFFEAGYCHQFYGVVFDGAGNPTASAPIPKVVALDRYPGTSPDNACRFFTDFDNCNTRAGYLNGTPVDHYDTTACIGSCAEGTVSITRTTSSGTSIDRYPDASMSIVGIDKPNYRNITDVNGNYRIYNISDPLNGETGRDYLFQAAPTLADSKFFASKTLTHRIEQQPIDWATATFPEIYSHNFIIGFRPSDCTSSCTMSTDPAPGTCRLACAGYNGCIGTGSSVDTGSTEYQALQACDGLGSGFVTSKGGENYTCCTQLASADLTKVHTADFTIKDAKNIARSERVVYINGKLVKLVVVTFDRK